MLRPCSTLCIFVLLLSLLAARTVTEAKGRFASEIGTISRAKDNEKEEKNINLVLDLEGEFALNDICTNAFRAVPGSIVNGNLLHGSADQNGALDCLQTGTDVPGLWYQVEGNGQVMRLSLVESNSTEVSVIIFSASDCSKLECQEAIHPSLTRMQAKEAAGGWTTFWGTQQDQTYLVYIYGRGTFQMMLTEQNRPHNDLPSNPTKLVIGTPFEGSTTFASSEDSVPNCHG
jgi:hypothetical protein